MTRKTGADYKLSEIANAAMGEADKREALRMEYRAELETHIEPLLKGYLYAMQCEKKKEYRRHSDKKQDGVFIRDDRKTAAVSISARYGDLYCSSSARALKIAYVRDENGYHVINTKKITRGIGENFNSIDGLIEDFKKRVSEESDDFKKHLADYSAKQERKKLPLLVRWGLKKPASGN